MQDFINELFLQCEGILNSCQRGAGDCLVLSSITLEFVFLDNVMHCLLWGVIVKCGSELSVFPAGISLHT